MTPQALTWKIDSSFGGEEGDEENYILYKYVVFFLLEGLRESCSLLIFLFDFFFVSLIISLLDNKNTTEKKRQGRYSKRQ
jgi:hypothetical protein